MSTVGVSIASADQVPGRIYPSLLDLEFEALQRALVANGVSPVHTLKLWRAIYADGVVHGFRPRWWEQRELLPPVIRWLGNVLAEEGSYRLALAEQVGEIASDDAQTHKYLLRLADGRVIETVCMSYPGRYTACVSTQVGCAMGCVFCATGQGGFGRNLTPSEIVAQVIHVERALLARGLPGLRNLVLMGMGEPLHNYDAVLTALRIISDNRGLNLGPRHITLSTVGVVPGIRRLARERQPFNLAVSLHAANQAERVRLVPVAQRWPLDELMDACREFGAMTGREIFFEWTLIAGQNDSPEHAREVAALLHGLEAHVNLIPLNRTSGFAGATTVTAAADVFRATLRAAGVPVTIRQRRGIDVAAGCGQLAGRPSQASPLSPVKA